MIRSAGPVVWTQWLLEVGQNIVIALYCIIFVWEMLLMHGIMLFFLSTANRDYCFSFCFYCSISLHCHSYLLLSIYKECPLKWIECVSLCGVLSLLTAQEIVFSVAARAISLLKHNVHAFCFIFGYTQTTSTNPGWFWIWVLVWILVWTAGNHMKSEFWNIYIVSRLILLV